MLVQVNFTSVPATISEWQTLNGCSTTPTSSYTLNDTTCTTYGQGCSAPVRYPLHYLDILIAVM